MYAFACDANALGPGEGSEHGHENVFPKRVFLSHPYPSVPYPHSVPVTAESCLLSPESSWATYSLIKFMTYIVMSLQCSRIRGRNNFLFQRFSCNRRLPSLSHSLLVNVNVQLGESSTGEASSSRGVRCHLPGFSCPELESPLTTQGQL